jgi:peptide-methionine (S)-S-oxide reductase
MGTDGQGIGGGAERELATLGGGCFWCLEAVFEGLIGVERVRSGYAGGRTAKPTYRQVCSGDTGHAEVVEIRFDPALISYKEILDVFFTIHDPTTLNRQGNDVGTQYRSIIFYHSPQQKVAAEQAIAAVVASGKFREPVVTELAPAPTFYGAEDYHQEYFRLHGHEPYCQFVVAPKVAKFRKKFADRLRS